MDLSGFTDEDHKAMIAHPFFHPDIIGNGPKASAEELDRISKYSDIPVATDKESEGNSIDFGSMCFFCTRLKNVEIFKRTCDAFPDSGIPKEIIKGRDHRKPFPGDNNIQFECKPGKEKAFEEWFEFLYPKKLNKIE